MFCTFWLENALRATAACNFARSKLQKAVRRWCVLYIAAFNFSRSKLQKAVRRWGVLCILTWKWASRHSGVQFLDIWTSKSPPRQFFSIFTWKCASHHSGVQFLDIRTSKSPRRPSATSAPAALASLLFDPADTQSIEKTQRFVTFLTFRACRSSFYWLSRNCIFFLLTLLLLSAFHLLTLLLCSAFQLSILSEVRLLNFVHPRWLAGFLPSTVPPTIPNKPTNQAWWKIAATGSSPSVRHLAETSTPPSSAYIHVIRSQKKLANFKWQIWKSDLHVLDWVAPPPSNSDKWRFSWGFPTKNGIILILGDNPSFWLFHQADVFGCLALMRALQVKVSDKKPGSVHPLTLYNKHQQAIQRPKNNKSLDRQQIAEAGVSPSDLVTSVVV